MDVQNIFKTINYVKLLYDSVRLDSCEGRELHVILVTRLKQEHYLIKRRQYNIKNFNKIISFSSIEQDKSKLQNYK